MYQRTHDTFCEYLVKPKLNNNSKAILIGIWVAFLLLAIGLSVISALNSALGVLLIPLAVVCIYLAYHLTSKLNAEFEYINTNGEIDIDRILNGKKRQNMANFKCSSIERIESYNRTLHKQDAKKRVYHACTADENSLVLTIRHPKGGVYTLVLERNEDFIESMKKHLPFELKNKI